MGQTLCSARYEVREIIDSGGKGIVYKVYDKINGVVKAIKLFPPKYDFSENAFEKIRNEVNLADKISHPNVLKVSHLEIDSDKQLTFIVMEYIDGYPLEEKLSKNPGNKLTEEETLEIMKQIASGLMGAHGKGVLHRDIKSKNIMIVEDSETKAKTVKILNFGQSCELKRATKKIDKESLLFNTLIHMPPERLPGIWEKGNEQEDIWGFGLTFYQLLTGKLPFDELKELANPDIPTPDEMEGISNKTKAVVMKCLEKDRARRYKNLEEVYYDLFEFEKETQFQEIKIEEAEFQDTGRISHKENSFPEASHNVRNFFVALAAFVTLGVVGILIFQGIFTSPKTSLYKMWYSGNPGYPEIPGGGIGYATSNDGINWYRHSNNPVIPHGNEGQFNQFESAFPYTVYDGELFHMLFRGRRDNGNLREYHIGYATSPNGIQWNLAGDNHVVLDNGNIKYPGPIIYTNGHYKMWYTDNGDIYYAGTTSSNQSILEIMRYGNGPVLTKGSTGEWDSNGIEAGSVLFEDNTYKMWYTGKSELSYKIGYATSTDGIKWQKYSRNPVYDDRTVILEMNPSVVHNRKGYKMYYTAATEGNDYYPVRLATSPNGITWEKRSNEPVLPDGKNNWGKLRLFVTTVKVEEQE